MQSFLPWVLAACGSREPPDLDRDGMPDRWDCDDRDPTTLPTGTEVADQRDNDCDGVVDELVLSEVARTRFTGTFRYAAALPAVAVGEVAGGEGPDLVMSLPCIVDDEACGAALVAVSDLPSGDADPLSAASAFWTGLPAETESRIFVDPDRVVVAMPGDGEVDENNVVCPVGRVVGVPTPLAGTGDLSDAPSLVGSACWSNAGTLVAIGAFQAAQASVALWMPGDLTLALAAFPEEGEANVLEVAEMQMVLPYGASALLAGDLDADGRDDLLVQQPTSGQWLLASDPQASLVPEDLIRLDSGYCAASGPEPAMGDLDGDGQPDLVLATCKGLTIAAGPFLHDRIVTNAVPRVVSRDNELFERGLTVADFDGDGVDDLAFGARYESLSPYEDQELSQAGYQPVVYVHLGPLEGVIGSYELASSRFAGDHESESVGRSLAAGDLDGDGAAELFVGMLPEVASRQYPGPMLSIVAGMNP